MLQRKTFHLIPTMTKILRWEKLLHVYYNMHIDLDIKKIRLLISFR